MLTDPGAMGHVRVGKLLGRGERDRLLFLDGFAPCHGLPDSVHGVDRIHRGWSVPVRVE